MAAPDRFHALDAARAFALLLVSYRYLVRPTFLGALLNGRKYPRGSRTLEPPTTKPGAAMAR
jgi:hypothetical protein